MKYKTANEHGRRLHDVTRMLDAFAVAFNHREEDKQLRLVVSPMMKVAAHLLGETIQALNLEAMTSPELAAEMKEALKEAVDDEARWNDGKFHRRDPESD